MSPSDLAPEKGSQSTPERAHLVTAIGAILVDDPLGAAVALQAAIDASSWEAVDHRIAVAVRALTVDADLEPWLGPQPDAATGELDDVEEAWADLWTRLHAVADLVDRAGYPPEVLA